MTDEPVDVHVAHDRSNDEARILRGALLAAKATELAAIQRRDTRLFAGYGTDSSREDMSAEMVQHRRRIELLDRLLEALGTPG